MGQVIDLNRFLDEVREEIEYACRQKEYEKAVCCTKFLCSFYYEFNYKFQDMQLESYIRICATAYVGEIMIENTDKMKVLFYDGFALYNRGLANIYINALLSLGYQVVWCLFETGAETDQILHRYNNKTNLKFALIPKLSVTERMYALKEIILEEKAYHSFIYTTPFDVEAIGVFSVLSGDVMRYLINLTDHTFWFGRGALDRCIEFRNFGANLSVKFRKLKEEQIVILPYYPEKRTQEIYQGLPFSDNDKFVFSGGSTYKIEGSDVYERMVSELLDSHSDLKFIFATNDKSEKLDALTYKYKNRFFVIKERADLDELMLRAKFFLSTYPVPGFLMIQYALLNDCVPLCLVDKNNVCANPMSYLLYPEKIDFVFYEVDALLKMADQLLAGQNLKRKKYRDFVISEKDFERNLRAILDGKNTNYLYTKKDVDMNVFRSYYVNRLTAEHFREVIRRSNNKWLKEKYPGLFDDSNIFCIAQ